MRNKESYAAIAWFALISGSLLFAFYIALKPNEFEVEGSCNTGFVGVDFKSHFDITGKETIHLNDREVLPYRILNKRYVLPLPIPERLDIKNMDGMNCNFKVKGKLPTIALIRGVG